MHSAYSLLLFFYSVNLVNGILSASMSLSIDVWSIPEYVPRKFIEDAI
jgi:hypothetical protein